MRLTVKTIENLKPGPARREIADDDVRGLYLMLQPSGAKSFALRYRDVAGKPRKLTIGAYEMGLGAARRQAAAARAAIAAGNDPAGDKRAARQAARRAPHDSVESVVADFIAGHVERNNKPSTAIEYRRLLEREIVGAWHGRRLADITRRDVNQLLDDIVKRGAPIAANRIFAILRKLCRWALSREIIPTSPCDGVQARSLESPRDRVLDDRELKLIWTASESLGWPYSAIVRLLMLTGARRGEVVGMRWGEIDLEKRQWSLPPARTKNKRPHVVPLSPAVVDILARLPHIATDDDLVFPTSRGDTSVTGHSRAKIRLDRAVAKIVEAEKSPPLAAWGFHDLRRSFASGLAKLSVDLHVIERCLNHVSGSFGGIVGVYQRHKFEDEMGRAFDLWAVHLLEHRDDNVIEFSRR
jgi:integrase